MAESFNSTLEFELLHRQRFATRACPAGGGRVDRRVQHRPPAFHQRHAQPCGLRTRTSHRPPATAGTATTNGGGMKCQRRRPPLSTPDRAARDYGAAPPASRVAPRSLRDGPTGPPLTPEPLRPLTRSGTGRTSSPARPAARRRHNVTRSLQINLYGFRGWPSSPTLPRSAGEWTRILGTDVRRFSTTEWEARQLDQTDRCRAGTHREPAEHLPRSRRRVANLPVAAAGAATCARRRRG